ncbi:hypothetical protein EDC96DRAFT_542372 [Choanephora cucurbitarum]|nr:hypothetical protein EDC96DRAFT_542372 [Choanephora cucurbitarum]
MKLMIPFVLAALTLLSVVFADIWTLNLYCSLEAEVLLLHSNELGSQTILWNKDNLKGGSELCSSDQVICVKDATINMNSCEEVTFDFKVQYANKWSNNITAVLHGKLSNVGYTNTILSKHFCIFIAEKEGESVRPKYDLVFRTPLVAHRKGKCSQIDVKCNHFF